MTKDITHDLQLVLVVWDDAWTDNEPVTKLSAIHGNKPTVIHTLGWLICDNAEGVTLVNEYYDDCYRGKTFIPRGMVKKVKPFNLSRQKQPKVIMGEQV